MDTHALDTSAAAAHFAARLAFETDPSDVHAALESGEPGFVLIDTRDQTAWDQGHARGAVHMPKPEMLARIPEYAAGTTFVVYCWGPGCNGATRAGLIISELGYAVKEMIGGFEYWAREGMPVDAVIGGAEVDATRAPDPLTAPALVNGSRIACDC
ncbi:rhodanese-like domain-containing protein [Demequina sp. NBRC 110056]|uniref:rhodanese-like domain-containing protein n=1 Tax=Demequina sp. NBRC 110056 TaxID=1570345 RepID=UPI0009FE89DE|nr:rhodanese-like domain-containing protein [Demequina sp. NBRC 110056]